MKLIRNKCFETNSSSCHSISVSSGTKLYDTIEPDEDGIIRIEGQDFGWEQDTYFDVQSKLSYLLIYIKDWARGQEEKFTDILNKVVKEHTFAKGVELIESDDRWNPHGYIDHQSVESSDLDYLFADEKLLKDFIFNPDSFIETDNDNH